MSDIRAPVTKEEIRKAYETGKYTFKQLAETYETKESTIKSWAKRDKDAGDPWTKGASGKVATKNKKVATEKKQKTSKVAEVIEEMEGSDLTDKQRLFCIYYVKYFNATKAAIRAGYSKDTGYQIGYQLLQKTSIQEEIQRLKAVKLKGAFLDKGDLLQKYIDIAFADITDFLEFGQEEVPVMTMYGPLKDEETGEVVTRLVNTVKFKESSNVDGTIISEVSQGKEGAKIKLQDKMKALDFLAKHMGLLDMDTQEKLKLAREKLEFEKGKASSGEDKPIEILIKRKGEGK